MILACGDCGACLQWEMSRVGSTPMLMSNCRHCNPAGAWAQEPVEIIRKPRGQAPDRFPQAPHHFPPLAPGDDPRSII